MMNKACIFWELVLFVCCLFWIFCSTQHEEKISSSNEVNEYPSQEGWSSKLYLTTAGKLKAIVCYGHMKKYDKQKMIYFDQGVEVDFYDRNGNHTSHLVSEKGEYNETTEDVMGMGNVVVVSDSGVTLRTEILRWINRTEKIVSDTLVMVTTQNNDTLYGIGFESNADLTRRIIRKPWKIR